MTQNANAAPVKKADELLAEVAANIAAGGTEIRSRVISAMVERKIAARAEMLGKAIDKLSDMRKDLYKLGPDQVSYVGSERVKVETFSKERNEQRTKHEENVAKLENSIETVLTNGNDDTFKKLNETMDKVSKSDK